MLPSNSVVFSKDSLPLIDWKRRLVIARSQGIGDDLQELESIIRKESICFPAEELPAFEETTGDGGLRGETFREQEQKWLDHDLTELHRELARDSRTHDNNRNNSILPDQQLHRQQREQLSNDSNNNNNSSN